jgi:hypothetical protein
VERGEHDRLVGSHGGEALGQPVDPHPVDGVRNRVDPRQRHLDQLVHTGQEVGCRAAPRATEHHHPIGAGGYGPNRRAGNQHVASGVRTHDQDTARAPARRARRLKEQLATQNLIGGVAQVSGDGRRCGDLLGQRGRRRYENAGCAGGAGGGHVPSDVADDNAPARIGAERVGRLPDQAGGGLPAAATGLPRCRFIMDAALPGIEGTEQLFDPLIDPADVVFGEQATGNSGLVGHHTESYPGCPQPVEGLASAVDGPDPIRVAIVGNVVHQGAVAIK